MNTKEITGHILAQLQAAGIEETEARQEARLIVQHVTGWKLAKQILHAQNELPQDSIKTIEQIVEQRRDRIPLQYCLGYSYFLGRKFFLKPGVFIPRPDTETLVEQAIRLLPASGHIAEIGTGSGAVVISLLKELPGLQATGIDCSDQALQITQHNAQHHQVQDRLTLLGGDWISVLPYNLDAVVANPPYIPRSQKPALAPEISLHEPELALFGTDDDGLGFYRQLSLYGPDHMKSGGLAILEVGDHQAPAVEAIFSARGWLQVQAYPDIHGLPRVISARADSHLKINC